MLNGALIHVKMGLNMLQF